MVITPERVRMGEAVPIEPRLRISANANRRQTHKNSGSAFPLTGPAAQPVAAAGLANLANGHDRGSAPFAPAHLAIAALPATRCEVAPGPAEVHDETMGRALPN